MFVVNLVMSPYCTSAVLVCDIKLRGISRPVTLSIKQGFGSTDYAYTYNVCEMAGCVKLCDLSH